VSVVSLLRGASLGLIHEPTCSLVKTAADYSYIAFDLAPADLVSKAGDFYGRADQNRRPHKHAASCSTPW